MSNDKTGVCNFEELENDKTCLTQNRVLSLFDLLYEFVFPTLKATMTSIVGVTLELNSTLLCLITQ